MKQIQIQQKKDNKNNTLKEIYEKFFKNKTLYELVGDLNFNPHHKYSLFNQLYLKVQAGFYGLDYQALVKPFNEWKKEKTFIRSGEKGLKVFVPIFFKKIDEKTQEEKFILKGFVQKPVFDISQTTSKEFKDYQEKKDKFIYDNPLNIDYEIIKIFVEKNLLKGHKIKEEFKQQECKGSFNPLTKTIKVYSKDSQTLLHEFSHSITEDLKEDINNDYAYNEILAEILTYLISQRLGATEYNFNYSNLWATRIKQDSFEKFISIFNKLEKKINELDFNLK